MTFPKRIRQSRAAKAQKSRSQVSTLPSPTGGWNARDAISDMPPTDAVQMVNVFPQATSCDLRAGFELQDTLQAINTTGNAMLLVATTILNSQYATTPDSAASSITGDIEIIAYAALDNWGVSAINQTFVSKGSDTGLGTATYQFRFIGSTTNLSFFVRDSGGSFFSYSSSALSFTSGTPQWVRVTLALSNGVNSVATFYTGNDGINWTSAGTALGGIIAALENSAQPLTIGVNRAVGGVAFSNPANGRIYQAKIYNGIGGTLAVNFDASDGDIGDTSFSSTLTGEVYTLVSGASIIYDTQIPPETITGTDLIESLMAYQGGASSKLFAIAGAQVWNVTTQNTTTLETPSLRGSRWGHVNIATPGGNFLFMVNQQGFDSPYHYNGTTWTQPAITGITTSNIVNVNLFKNRLWFIELNTLKAWYLPTQSIAGAVSALDLSAFATRGGYLMAMATWTIDAGYGMDDYAAFITSQGEVIVFGGTDPSSSATWSMIGVFWMGSPVGRRCYVKYAGDVLIISQDGVQPLSGALQSSRLNPRVSLSDKIRYAMSTAVSAYSNNFGWQVMPFPKQNMLIVNVPVQENEAQEQYVMNTITGSWARFTGMNANCWELLNDELYFGGNDRTVNLAWSGTSDNFNAIDASVLQAFSYFGSQGQQKRFTMMRPVFLANGDTPVAMRINTDFNQNIANDVNSFTNVIVTGALWDQAIWDADVWANDFVPATGWRGATGVGFCGAPEMGISTADRSIKWLSTDIVLEAGAIL